MNLPKIEKDTHVFIDANIFVYYLINDENYFEKCAELFGRVEKGEIVGFTNIVVFNETLFTFINNEIIREHHLKPNEIIRFLKKNPSAIPTVDISDVKTIFKINNLYFKDPPADYLINHLNLYHQYGLLSNDIYHLICMKYMGIQDIITNDSDFERVPLLNVWKP